MQMLFDNLLIQPKPAAAISEKIVIPDTIQLEKDSTMEGYVALAGPDCKTVKQGDFVLFKAYLGDRFKHQGREWHAIKESEVIIIFDKTK